MHISIATENTPKVTFNMSPRVLFFSPDASAAQCVRGIPPPFYIGSAPLPESTKLDPVYMYSYPGVAHHLKGDLLYNQNLSDLEFDLSRSFLARI